MRLTRIAAAQMLAAGGFHSHYSGIRCCADSPSTIHRRSAFASPTSFPVAIKRRSFSITAMESPGGQRLGRFTRANAEKALFDYLHSTRSLPFADAEHISCNSPVFLRSLLSKLEGAEDVRQSLTRFLRFHPINEFEPFFESLGLTPSELQQCLPVNLMYLADDAVLFANYRVLCHYGVPRSKIGRMYKEGGVMFQYGHGVLQEKLRAYENLGLSKPTIIKLITCCPALLVGDVSAEFLSVHKKLKWLGVELDWLRGFFSDKSTYNWNQISNMLEFFERMGCDKVGLGKLVRGHPRLIFDDSGRKFYVLVALLLKLGFKMDTVLNLLMQCPRILVGKFVRNFCRSVNFLVCIHMETEDIAMVALSHPHVLGACYCLTPCYILKKLDVSESRLCEMIKENPRQFVTLASTCQNFAGLPKVADIFLWEKTNFLLRLGFMENSDEMVKALSSFKGRGDQLQERFDCLVEAGLDYHMVVQMIKSYPNILNQSADMIKKKINYLCEDMGYSLDELAQFPGFLCYNLDKIKTRCLMHKWVLQNREQLLSTNKCRNLHRPGASLSSILACSERRFVRYVVDIHPEGPKQWERLNKLRSLDLVFSR